MPAKLLQFLGLSLIFLTFFNQQGNGQSYVYPIKKDHKWGYINLRGKILIEPQFDLVGEEAIPWYHPFDKKGPSNFRLVEIDKKIGLIDESIEVVLPPNYQIVRPLTKDYFMVKTDSLFYVVNRKEEVVLDGAYEDLVYLNTDSALQVVYFMTRKFNKWGVFKTPGIPVLPLQYDSIQHIPFGNGFFKVKKNRDQPFWGLVNSRNQQLLPPKYLNIQGHHADFFVATDKNDKTFVVDSLGQIMGFKGWSSFETLNQQFLEMRHPMGDKCLYSFQKKDTIQLPRYYESLSYFDDHHLLGKRDNIAAILDTALQEIFVLAFTHIDIYNEQYLKVKNERGWWGLVHRKNGQEALPCEYEAINPFVNGFAKVKGKDGLGLGIMDTALQIIIPTMYDDIITEGKIFKAFQGRQLSMFEIGEDGQIAGMDDFSRVFNININKRKRKYIEAPPLKYAREKRSDDMFMMSNGSPRQMDSSMWQWDFDRGAKAWGLNKIDSNDISQLIRVSPPIYRTVKHILNANWSLVYSNELITRSNFAELMTPNDTLCKFAIFDHDVGKIIGSFNWVGLRRSDFERGFPYAAMLDEEGNFGLANRKGERVKDKNGNPLSFTYIGEFFSGLARVAIGGRIKRQTDPAERKFALEPLQLFKEKFALIDPPNNVKLTGNLMVTNKGTDQPLWGYIDTLGNMVIEPQYEYAKDLLEGQMVVYKDGASGVVTPDNKQIVPFEYVSISPYYKGWRVNKKGDHAILFNREGWNLPTDQYERRGSFKEGYCKVMKDSLWGFINDNGVETTACQYEQVRDYSEGLAAVYGPKGWSFIDTSGHTAFLLSSLNLQVDELGDFHEGLAWFKSGKWYGFVNTSGDLAIAPNFTRVFGFQHGVARVVANKKTGLINTKGEFVMQPDRFERVYPFNEFGVTVAMERFKGGKRGLINARGEVLTPIHYQEIAPFKEGVAKITDGKKFGLIDTLGREILPVEYAQIGEFAEGLVPIKDNAWTKWYFVDQNGKQAFKGKFEIAYAFNNGFATVQVKAYDGKTRMIINKNGRSVVNDAYRIQFHQGGLFGMITKSPRKRNMNYYYADRFGNNIFSRYFQNIEPFEQGCAIVKVNWRKGLLNDRGLMVIPPKYVQLQLLNDGVVLAKPPAFGLINKAGKEMIKASYDRIEILEGKVYRLEQGEKIGYMREDGSWLWELQN